MIIEKTNKIFLVFLLTIPKNREIITITQLINSSINNASNRYLAILISGADPIATESVKKEAKGV